MTREATITVYTPRLTPQTLIVTQAPAKVLAVSPVELIIGSEEGSTARFNISSNTDWTVQSSQPWLDLSSVNGKGNMEIILTAESNPEFTEREAVISISADEVPLQSIALTQEAAVPTGLDVAASEAIEIYPNPVRSALHIDHAGGGEMLLLDSGGRIIHSHKLSGDHETIDLSFLSPGQYLIKISDRMIKLVKQ